jgi:anti-anti-sigma regulatory factor
MTHEPVDVIPAVCADLPRDSALVALAGIVDLQARPALTTTATLLVTAQPTAVCVDLSAATYFGPDGLRFLANLARCDSALPACRITVASPSPTARRALEITGFTDLLSVTSRASTPFRAPGRAGPIVTLLIARSLSSRLDLSAGTD